MLYSSQSFVSFPGFRNVRNAYQIKADSLDCIHCNKQLWKSWVFVCLLPFFLSRTRALSRHASPLLNTVLVLFLSIGLHFRTARESDVVVLLHVISLKVVAMVICPAINRKICLLRERKN